jgi:hypothetical protein
MVDATNTFDRVKYYKVFRLLLTRELSQLWLSLVLITAWRNALSGQVNDILCYFGNHGSIFKQSLMKNYCTSLYGCEIWDLNDSTKQNICTAWRQGIRRVWGIHHDTHNELITLICCTLPMMDEICTGSINIIYKCLQSVLFRGAFCDISWSVF